MSGATFTASGSTFIFNGPTNTGQGKIMLDSFTVSGGSTYEYLDLPFDLTFQRRGSSTTANVIYMLGAGGASDQNPVGSRQFSMEQTMNARDLSAGVENLFQTSGTTHNKQIERVDYVYSGGLTLDSTQTPSQFGFAFFERNANNNFHIAAITGIDGNNNITSVGSIVKFGPGTSLLYGTANQTGFTRSASMQGTIADPNSAVWNIVTGQDLGGVFITLGDLGISVGQTIYGYVLLAGDQSTLPTDINNFSAYSTDNGEANVGGDLYGGGMIFRLNTASGTILNIQNYYWDRNGATAGAGTGATLNGTWSNNASDANWGSQNGGVATKRWADNRRAVFSAGTSATGQTYTVTVAAGQTVKAAGIRVEEGTLTLAGGNASSAIELNMVRGDVPQIEIANGLTTTISTRLTGTSGFTKMGGGNLVLTGNNSISGTVTQQAGNMELAGTGTNSALGGATAINLQAGTLLLSASHQIHDTANMTLSGGNITVNNLIGHQETLGTLTLSANSTLNLGTGSSVINFANSSSTTWAVGSTLTITNWSGNHTVGGGTDRVFFGTTSGGLTSAQVSQIKFLNPFGLPPGTYDAIILATGEVVPVPEPGVWLSALLLITLALWPHRGKIVELGRKWSVRIAG